MAARALHTAGRVQFREETNDHTSSLANDAAGTQGGITQGLLAGGT